MKLPAIDIKDLKPAPAPFKLGVHQGMIFTFKPFSLATKTWVIQEYGSLKALNLHFERGQIESLVELFWYLLKEKEFFNNSKVEFYEAVQTPDDEANLLNAITVSLGVSQVKANEIYKALEGDGKKILAQSQKKSRSK